MLFNVEQVALLQSRISKRKNKQGRIRAVDDDDHRDRMPRKAGSKPAAGKSKKKQSNFANDLTDTSRSAAKRLRYDANKVQKGKSFPPKGKGKTVNGRSQSQKGKAFGKPQAKKGGKKSKF